MPKSPFNFVEKAKMWALTGVDTDRVILDSQPYRAPGLVAQFDAKSTILLFAVSEKDMAEDPRFQFKPKKDGSPSYFQKFTNLQSCETLDKHGYMMTVPTFDFTVLGKPARSASEIRAQFAGADLATQRKIVTDLFGKFDNNVFNIMKARLESTVTEVAIDPNPSHYAGFDKKGVRRLTMPKGEYGGLASTAKDQDWEVRPIFAPKAPQPGTTLMKKGRTSTGDNVFTEETNSQEMARLKQQLKKAFDRRDYNSLDAIKLNIRKLQGEIELRARDKASIANSQRVFSENVLDVPTLSPMELANLHKLPVKQIIEQLRKGIAVEQEHTSDEKVATEIALDHIKEDPGYYDKLATVEESKINEGVSEQNLDNPDPKISSLAKAAVKMKQQLQAIDSSEGNGLDETIVPGFGEMTPEQVKKEVAGLTAEMLKYAREGNMRAVAEYMKKLQPFVDVARAEITESVDKAMRTVRRNAI
jgi:hypothetical protein